MARSGNGDGCPYAPGPKLHGSSEGEGILRGKDCPPYGSRGRGGPGGWYGRLSVREGEDGFGQGVNFFAVILPRESFSKKRTVDMTETAVEASSQ